MAAAVAWQLDADGFDPVVPLSSQRQPQRSATSGQSEPSHAHRPPAKVLVVEDDPDLRETLRAILRMERYDVFEAPNAGIAVAELQRHDVDVLVLDLHMPGRDGVTMLRVMQVPPPIVIVHSAFEYFSPDEVERAVGHKVFRSLRKPVPPPELIAAVAEAVVERQRFR
ncbi:MAG: response regulator [Acidimicrobiales bacterium]